MASQILSETKLVASSHSDIYPPTIYIPPETRRSPNVNEAYSRALDEHGPVIVVPRHGRNEYVIDHKYAHEVLTNTKDYEFDKVVFDFLRLGFLAVFDKEGRFVHDISNLIEKCVQPRMNAIIEKLAPIFQAYFDQQGHYISNAGQEHQSPEIEVHDIFALLQGAIAHAMVVLILGDEHVSPTTIDHFGAVAIAMAKMTGLYENTQQWAWLPALWDLLNGLSAVFLVIVPRFFFGIVPALWATRQRHLQSGRDAKQSSFVPLFDYLLAQQYGNKTGFASLTSFAWCVILCVGMIFASMHQTVVTGCWVVIILAQRQDEYLAPILKQCIQEAPRDEALTAKKLNNLTLLDSFIRETMRTKGDTWGPVRQTTRPVRIGHYVLPKGAVCMIHIARAHQHPDNYGKDGVTFDGFQWERKEHPAVHGDPGFLSFGLGRWACPGRALAINEMKMMVYLLFAEFEIRLKDNVYHVTDPINTTSLAPEATLIFRRRQA